MNTVKATVLTTLKNLGREPDGSDPLFTKKARQH
jgi:hypothetical protein